jgi:hypothetical protein
MAFIPPGLQTFTGPNGVPVALGTVAFYIPGTTTPKDTYSDNALTVLNTNPVSLDAAGRASVWAPTGSYRQIIKDVLGNTVWDRVVDAGDVSFAAELASTAIGLGDTLVSHTPAVGGSGGRTVNKVIDDFGLNIMDYGGVGQGTPSVDTAAWQDALAKLASGQRLIVPPAAYQINATLAVPANLQGVEIVAMGGYDGTIGPLNSSLHTSLKWVGSSDPTKAVVKFDQATGCVWRGISVNCNYLAGYGIQLMSSSGTHGGVKNIIERASIHYAARDGIIVGDWGIPTAGPGARQFFGNEFRTLTMYGCGTAGVHINEWNADQQTFENVMVYMDDAASPQNTLNAFWFDHGGQQSRLVGCESGGMTVVAGVPSSGFAIRNEGNDNSSGGAFGLEVVNFWQEGAGGLYRGVTGTSDGKGNKFNHCYSFTNNTANRSVYIDKGTSDQIAHTFDTCTFLSDVEIASSTFNKEALDLRNCTFAAGRGVIDSSAIPSRLTLNGVFSATTTSASFAIPRFADLMELTLNQSLSSLYAEGVTKKGDTLTVIVIQDGTGGWTINWANSGNFASQPSIPQPSQSANAKTAFTFVSDGSVYYLVAVRGLIGAAITDPTGGSTVDTEARFAVASILAFMRQRGDIG